MAVKGLIFVLLLWFSKEASGLRCYTCSASETDVDQSCISFPEKLSYTNCNKRYCTVQRVEYLDPKNKVQSIYRGCEDKPLHANEIVEDETYRIYYVACQTDLCNGGSGKSSVDNGNDGALGDKSTILAKGTGGAAQLLAASTLALIFVSIILNRI